MATVNATQVDQFQGFASVFQWTGLTQAGSDVGSWVYVGNLAFISVGYKSTAGADTSIDFETSFDGTNVAGKVTLMGSATSAKALTDVGLYIRPNTITGAGNVVNAFALGKRFN